MPYDTIPFDLPLAASCPGSTAVEAAHADLQRTLFGMAECSGIGVHSGEKVRLRLLPAPESTGIVFVRTDMRGAARAVPARWDHVVDVRLCTVIGNEAGARVATIEHLMAALSAYGIDNAFIEIDGEEVPVMDGSADPFVLMIEAAGIREQNAPRRTIEILRTVEVEHNGARARLSPALEPRFSFDIAFDKAPIRRQSHTVTLAPDAFKREIGRARTFGFYEEVDQLRKLGFARGGSLDNAIVIKDEKIMNEGGLRYPNEFVRHKILDAVGDLALAGAVLRGHFHGSCSGHALNNRLLRVLFADTSAWRLSTAEDIA